MHVDATVSCVVIRLFVMRTWTHEYHYSTGRFYKYSYCTQGIPLGIEPEAWTNLDQSMSIILRVRHSQTY